MRVVYLGRPSTRARQSPRLDGDVIELLSNNWDDFGSQTSFPVLCRVGDAEPKLGSLKLLLEGVANSSAHLDAMLQNGWDGTFPAPGANYISIPSEIEFYQQLAGLVGMNETVGVARALRDASLMTRIDNDPAALALTQTEPFAHSLQRERGAVKAFLDGWQVFNNQTVVVNDVAFRFRDVFDEVSTLRLKFQSERPLPHDINVLIGPNGVGKSRVLHAIVADWIHPERAVEGFGFSEKPNLSQIVVVSYSPFETFPVDLAGEALSDREVYKYFGFRGRGPRRPGPGVDDDDFDLLEPPPRPIILSHDFPRTDAATSLLACAIDDRRYVSIAGWPGKLSTMERVLKTAIDFDLAAINVDPAVAPATFYTDATLAAPLTVEADGERFLPIGSRQLDVLDTAAIEASILPQGGVTFFRDGQQLKLSSGQRLFSYIVINVLGAIKRNSLILVDEPELFLHPTLEIQFIEMLKEILTSLSSKALLATHSVVTVREMPSDCVHVFERTADGLVVSSPPFQTFAGDIQRISSYVFGDRSAVKPHEAWIRQQLELHGSAQALLDALGEDTNEELIIQIRALESGRW